MCILSETQSKIKYDNQSKSCFDEPFTDELTGDFNTETLIDQARHYLPYVLMEGGYEKYILLTEISNELNEWIHTGKTEEVGFRVLSDNKENKLRLICRSQGLTVTRGCQMMEYMGHSAEIEYLRVRNPAAETSVAMIPWFMLPRKKYPVFVYLFTYWYCKCLQKSVRESATAAEQLFMVKIHYSVICRSMIMAKALFDIEEPISTTSPTTVPIDDILNTVPALLSDIMVKNQSHPTEGKPENALANMTKRFANIIRPGLQRTTNAILPFATPVRKKQTQKANPDEQPVKPKPFIEKRVRRIRQLFIVLCRRFVLNTAIQYQKFLL
jgi:hypothetical protein